MYGDFSVLTDRRSGQTDGQTGLSVHTDIRISSFYSIRDLSDHTDGRTDGQQADRRTDGHVTSTRLVILIKSDEQTDMARSPSSDADQEYTYFMGSETLNSR